MTISAVSSSNMINLSTASSTSSQVQNQIQQLQQQIIKEQASKTDDALTKQQVIQMLQAQIQMLVKCKLK
jgi:hypothetical protein